MITFTHEGTINVSMPLPDQTKKNIRIRLVDTHRFHFTEERKFATFSMQRDADATECSNVDSLMNPHLLREAGIHDHNVPRKFDS